MNTKSILTSCLLLLLLGCSTQSDQTDFQIFFEMGDVEYKSHTPQERQQEKIQAELEGKPDRSQILMLSVAGSWIDETGENLPNTVYIACWFENKVCHESIAQVMKGTESKRIWFNNINYLEIESWDRGKIVAVSPGQCFNREITIDRIAQTVTSRAEFIGDPQLCDKLMETKPRINRLGNYPKALDAILNR